MEKGQELIKNVVQARNESSTESSLTKEDYEESFLSKNTNLLLAAELAKLLKKHLVANTDSTSSAPPAKSQCVGPPISGMEDAMAAQQTDGNCDCVVQFDLFPQETSTSEEKKGMDQEQ
eukprot:11951607-Ditylum_brightwellii.AAC.1